MDKHKIKIRLNALHQLLEAHDYIGTKIATGRATAEDYAVQIERMKEWATEINILEAQLKVLGDS